MRPVGPVSHVCPGPYTEIGQVVVDTVARHQS